MFVHVILLLGTALLSAYDSVDDLIEIDIPRAKAKTLFSYVTKWKNYGLPQTYLDELTNAATNNDTDSSNNKEVCIILKIYYHNSIKYF